MLGQVMSKVPIWVAAGPSNGFLVLVWYVMIIIIIILEYDNVIIGRFLTSYHLAPLWGPSPFDLEATFSQFTLHLTSFNLLIPAYWLPIHLLSLRVTHLYLWVTKIDPHATLNAGVGPLALLWCQGTLRVSSLDR